MTERSARVRRLLPAAGACVAALLLAACASDSTGTAITEPATVTPTTAAPTTVTPTTVTPPTATPPTAAPASTVTVVPESTVAPAVRSPSPGCGQAPPELAPAEPSGDVPLSLTVGGVERTYRLAVPAGYDPSVAAPVVLALHGAGSNAVQQSIYSRLPERGAVRGYVVITPDAIGGTWEGSGSGADDEFLTTLLDTIGERYCVDLDRVSATGISLGSWEATIVACTHPERFAAIALVAEEVAPQGCALPVVAFHGTADPVVPYGAGADPGVTVIANNGLPGVEINMPQWATNAGCSSEPTVTRLEPDVAHWVYPGCPAGHAVEFYSIEHGGHTWPGATIEIGPTTGTIDATEIILDWFDAHPRAG